MRVLYYNNCWFTNVGEAFIDIGGMSLLKKIFPEYPMACCSEMTTLYSRFSPCSKKIELLDYQILNRIYDPIDFMEADYLVFPGMFACKDFVNDCKGKIMADQMRACGTKIVFLGLGGQTYGSEEVELCKRYFEKIQPELIITRDNVTYDNYKDVAPCIRGIDCAFWINDSFNPKGFTKKKYDVITFNRSKEPEMFKDWEVPVIRPWHMQFSYKKNYFTDGRMISDTPYDYLTIYANANRVYTDLVHAVIPSLTYGVPVKYWYIDKRSYAFDAVEGLKNEDGWLTVECSRLEAQKEKLEVLIREKLGL